MAASGAAGGARSLILASNTDTGVPEEPLR
jgi:hypothetical protein